MPPRKARQGESSVAAELGIPVGAAAAGASAAPAATTATGTALSAAAVSQITRRIIAALVRHDRRRISQDGSWIYAALLQQAPGQEALAKTVVTNERKREQEFQRKRRERLLLDLPPALADPNPARRQARVNQIMERERQYEQMRAQAVMDRAQGRLDLEHLRILSPHAVFWWLDPNVKKHTPDCLVMGNKLWPFEVVEIIHPPLHPGCPCQLFGEDEARELGYMHPDTRIVSKDGVRRAMEDFKRAKALEHALPPEEVASLLTALEEGAAKPEEAVTVRSAGKAFLQLLENRIEEEPGSGQGNA